MCAIREASHQGSIGQRGAAGDLRDRELQTSPEGEASHRETRVLAEQRSQPFWREPHRVGDLGRRDAPPPAACASIQSIAFPTRGSGGDARQASTPSARSIASQNAVSGADSRSRRRRSIRYAAAAPGSQVMLREDL